MPDNRRQIDPDHVGAEIRQQHRAVRQGLMPANSTMRTLASGPRRDVPEVSGARTL